MTGPGTFNTRIRTYLDQSSTPPNVSEEQVMKRVDTIHWTAFQTLPVMEETLILSSVCV